MQSENFLTTRVAAQRLGICESTIRNLVRAGKISAAVDTTGRRLFRESEIERFKEASAASGRKAKARATLRDLEAREGVFQKSLRTLGNRR